MSGSNEERPTAAEETAAAEPTSGAQPAEEADEMSAAQALARVTEAAETADSEGEADRSPEPSTAAEDAIEAAVDGEAKAESPAEAEAGAEAPAEADAAAETAEETQAVSAPGPPEPAASANAEPPEPPDEATMSAAADEVEPASAPEPVADVVAEAEAAEQTDTTEAAPSAVEPAAKDPGEATAETERPPAAVATAAGDGAAAPEATEAKPPPPDRPELRAVREAMENRQSLEGRVIGWNQGGFHLALGELSAFCPRSEMEVGEVAEPESYLDRTFEFRVLRLQGKGRRIVVSRAAHLRNEKSRRRSALRKKLRAGVELDGVVASLKDFGAFVDVGGAQGLVHVSEISHRRVEHPRDVLSEGQEVRVKVLKVEQGGRRISLSIRALEPDPWKDLVERFPRGAVVKGTVEKANQIGAFIELAPGLTGLLPARSMSIPRETSPARAYPPGTEVSVQIVSVDPRRQRIALALEGSGLEGSRHDYKEYQQRQHREADEGEGFNALASAFRRLQDSAD